MLVVNELLISLFLVFAMSSHFNMGLDVQPSDVHEMQQNKEFRFANRYESSRHSQKPVHLAEANLCRLLLFKIFLFVGMVLIV